MLNIFWYFFQILHFWMYNFFVTVCTMYISTEPNNQLSCNDMKGGWRVGVVSSHLQLVYSSLNPPFQDQISLREGGCMSGFRAAWVVCKVQHYWIANLTNKSPFKISPWLSKLYKAIRLVQYCVKSLAKYSTKLRNRKQIFIF